MKTYILDTVERVKRYSQSLDVKTILCSKAWYVLNEDGDTENLIFQSDGSVLVSINGSTKKYTWQYIPQNQSLNIMHSETDGTMLKPAFLDGTILAFNKIGTKECMFLIDDSLDEGRKINSLESVKKYLLGVEGAAVKKAKAVEDKKKAAELAKTAKAVEDKKREESRRLEEERILQEKIKSIELRIQDAPEQLKHYKTVLNNIKKSEWGKFIIEVDVREPEYASKVSKASIIIFISAAVVWICNTILLATDVIPFIDTNSVGLNVLLSQIQIFLPIIVGLIAKLFYIDEGTYRYYQLKKMYRKYIPKSVRESNKFSDELLDEVILPMLQSYRNCNNFITNYSTYISNLNKNLLELKR